MPRDGYGAFPLGELKDILDAFMGGAQAGKNLQQLRRGTQIWATVGAAVGIHSNNDSFLIWTDLRKKGAVKIPATPEVIADFYGRIMPLIQQHRQVALALEAVEWEREVNHMLKTVVPTVVAGKLAARSSSAKKNTSGLTAAYDKVVAELEAFTKRWNAQPDN